MPTEAHPCTLIGTTGVSTPSVEVSLPKCIGRLRCHVIWVDDVASSLYCDTKRLLFDSHGTAIIPDAR